MNNPSKYQQYSSEEDNENIPKRDRSPDKTFDFTNKDLDELLINMENELDPNVVKKCFYYNSLRDFQKHLDRTKTK